MQLEVAPDLIDGDVDVDVAAAGDGSRMEKPTPCSPTS
jgi:hypothetical protein